MIPALIVIGILLICYGLLFLNHRRLKVTHAKIRHKSIQTPFRVVQVSDLHDSRFGKEQARLIEAIRSEKPDCIVITGDLFNRHNKNAYENAYTFVRIAVTIAPVYFAEGNHECSLRKTGEQHLAVLKQMGMHILCDESFDLPYCRLVGLRQYADASLLASLLSEKKPNLVLAHRPERFPLYASVHPDVVLSGHAHGGQIRLFGHGLYAPEQGWFPRYTAGEYRIGDSVLYVSRGLGNTILVPRVFNPPELCVLDLLPEAEEEE